MLSSEQRSTLYMIVNEKLYTQEIKHKYGMSANPYCEACGLVENFIHKIAKCKATEKQWKNLAEIITDLHIRMPEIELITKPELQRVNKNNRIVCLEFVIVMFRCKICK